MPRTLCLPATVDATAFRLLNEWQRDFPLEPRPFARIAEAVGEDEASVIAAYRRLKTQGLVSRVGAVFAPRRLGVSALAALAAPPDRLAAVAERVSREAAINHNYQREHCYNLWFVVTAASRAHLDEIVGGIERDTGCAVIVLPLEEEFHIDLGFDLKAQQANCGAGCAERRERRAQPAPPDSPGGGPALSETERRLIATLQCGLMLEPQPFARLGAAAGLDESETLGHIRRWQAEGLIRRFGVVVRHHELGLEANAMCVWDIPDAEVSALGRRLAGEAAVTLCYRRRRSLPDWPYNLFCMIHGSARDEVLAEREELARRLGLDAYPHAVLFSCRRFKQTGAQYLGTKDLAHA
ncbi:Lrp/AsnC family transcriptional regulator [Thauera aromatica]|uniref:siroheme decarboxylase subunit beta n=1 Tax=Thauera aromatica TaxID=59405 RepID=UPI001FFC9E07|nr:Lrp/AsnC family transcriptional regulator [Thauera aromatica]MCK2087622.1 Lrp/AsnC family transcriptional regulator [Thauera aromatica]